MRLSFLAREDYDAHDALMAIAEGSVVAVDDRRRLTPDHYLRSQAEMCELFADLPEAIDNTIEIAMRCGYYPANRNPILPRFTGASGDPAAAEKAEADELRRQAREGLEMRLATVGGTPGYTFEQYSERLEFEIGVIERMKYPGYFLIVSDFIKWAKQQGIPVGPGRGSGAGSLVAWVLTITDVDPLRFSLLFERFLNPDRVSMPDFDIDFCQDRRDEVIRYVQQKYGRDQVAQIITFGTLQARAVLRDVGRVLADALWPGRPAVQDGAAEPGQSGDPETGHRGRTALSGRNRPRACGADPARHRPETGRTLPPRLDARRRYRHRRPAAVGTGADVSRSALRHAGDPVQHEKGRGCGPGQIRLSWPEDADCAGNGGQADPPPRHRG
jgi:hypothetical protein